jgi:hypothetical protein
MTTLRPGSTGEYDASLAQPLDQFAAGAMDPRFDRADGAIHRRPDFGVAQLLFMEQHKGLSVLRADRGHRKLHFLAEPPGGLVVGHRIGRILDEPDRRHPPRPPRKQRAATIAGNRQQPWQKTPLPVPPPQALQRPDERLLRHVLGILLVVEHSKAESEDRAFELIHQLQNSRVVSRLAAIDQN